MFAFPSQPDFEPTTWTVGQLTSYVRQMFDLDYRLRDIDVSGEISNFTRAASGHLYFTLKDATAQLKCVMWRAQAERLRFRPAEGDAVVAHGRLAVYEVADPKVALGQPFTNGIGLRLLRGGGLRPRMLPLRARIPHRHG